MEYWIPKGSIYLQNGKGEGKKKGRFSRRYLQKGGNQCVKATQKRCASCKIVQCLLPFVKKREKRGKEEERLKAGGVLKECTRHALS